MKVVSARKVSASSRKTVLADEWALVNRRHLGAGQVVAKSCVHCVKISVVKRMNNGVCLAAKSVGVLEGATKDCHLSCCPGGMDRAPVTCRE